MYTCYQVVLIAEDGEYVLSEWQTDDRAYKEMANIEDNYGEGQRLFVREFSQSF